ncbi:EamA family transporter [Rhizobium ruizarguesonis]|uniref:EamA family transporter n=1 Tax=Rhizobium ruizarguesonis TaxID=2081791 RepID=UPI001FEF8723|nr:DMT family transporter [Rhizobium ruizarguesonis]
MIAPKGDRHAAGIVAGLTSCALWGLTFVAPRAIAPFTAWDLTIARYGIFGFACLLLMTDRRFRPVGIARSRLLIGLLLGGAGYVGYFVSTAFAVQLTGAAVPPVIVGTMPVFLAIISNLRDTMASSCLAMGNDRDRGSHRKCRTETPTRHRSSLQNETVKSRIYCGPDRMVTDFQRRSKAHEYAIEVARFDTIVSAIPTSNMAAPQSRLR